MAVTKNPPVMSPKARHKQIADLRTARDASTGDKQAWASINRQLIDLEREDYTVKQAAKNKRPTLTPEEAHAALIEQVIQAPPSFHWDVWQRLIELHPEWTEAEPVAEVVAFPGGKR